MTTSKSRMKISRRKINMAKLTPFFEESEVDGVKQVRTYVFTNQLVEWEKNKELRVVGPDGFRRLEKQLQELGEYKPVIVTSDGIIVGGGTRLKKYIDLGLPQIWISIVHAPDESTKTKYNLSDNDNVGFYNADSIANNLPEFNLDLADYAVNLEEPITLADLENDPSVDVPKDPMSPHKQKEIECPECHAKFTP